MPRGHTSFLPLTAAERQARRRAKLVTFRPTDKPALEAASTAVEREIGVLVAEIVDGWLRGAMPAPVPATASLVAAADEFGKRRQDILDQFTAVLNRARNHEDLQRIARRIAILGDVIKESAHD